MDSTRKTTAMPGNRRHTGRSSRKKDGGEASWAMPVSRAFYEKLRLRVSDVFNDLGYGAQWAMQLMPVIDLYMLTGEKPTRLSCEECLLTIFTSLRHEIDMAMERSATARRRAAERRGQKEAERREEAERQTVAEAADGTLTPLPVTTDEADGAAAPGDDGARRHDDTGSEVGEAIGKQGADRGEDENTVFPGKDDGYCGPGKFLVFEKGLTACAAGRDGIGELIAVGPARRDGDGGEAGIGVGRMGIVGGGALRT